MKKLTERFTAILTVILIVAISCGYEFLLINFWNKNKPKIEHVDSGIKNIILFIGDGMGETHVKATDIYNGYETVFESFPYRTYADTLNLYFLTTDSAAAATALASGIRTQNGMVGMTVSGDETQTIMDFAKAEGKLTGVISTESLSGATPAGFSAHAVDRGDTDSIICSQAKSGIDFFGGDFSADYADLYLPKFTENGYRLIKNLDEIKTVKGKVLFQADIANEQQYIGETPMYTMLDGLVNEAVKYLAKDTDGFVLMVEGAYIDKYSHSNDTINMIKSLTAFDRAVGCAYDWARERKDTVIMVTADHETGCLGLDNDASHERFAAGDFSSLKWGSGGHTIRSVPLYVYGYDFDFGRFSKIQDENLVYNTDIIKMMKFVL